MIILASLGIVQKKTLPKILLIIKKKGNLNFIVSLVDFN